MYLDLSNDDFTSPKNISVKDHQDIKFNCYHGKNCICFSCNYICKNDLYKQEAKLTRAQSSL